MTISSSTRVAGPYTGNGSTTAFPFSFKVFTTADVTVIQTDLNSLESTLVLGTNYTVALNANQNSNPGGTVTMLSAPASGYKITLTSSIGYTQTLDLTNQGGFYPTTINDALDRLVVQIQQVYEQVSRSVKVSISSGISTDTLTNYITAIYANLANIIAVNSNSANINSAVGNATNINTVAGNNANVAAVGSNIANVNTVAGISANVTSVAGNATNVNTVAGSIANVNTVAGSVANVNTNATNIASINTNASNITAIQNASANATTATTQAGIATTQATNAASSATAASASAAAAAAAAASGLYRQVLDKSANYTIVAADSGTLFRANTGSGALTFTLPSISTVTDGYRVAVVKWTNDANVVNINRAGSDTINGATTVQIGSQYSQVIFVADFETNTWFASQSGLGATNKYADPFSGNASTTAFTLSAAPGATVNVDVYISGVHQVQGTDFTVSGTTLTFTTAPPTGTNNILAVYGTPLAIGTPSDGTVTPAKMSTGAPSWDGSGNVTMSGNLVAGNGAANKLSVNGNVTGQPAYMTATGTDTNVGIDLNTKGTGPVRLNVNNSTVLQADGSLVTLPFGQLKFPATQNPSSDANTLDDYEEGTWTPSDTSGAGLTLSSASGVYTKVGRLVTVIGRLIWPANASGLVAQIGGLPFAQSAGYPGFATQWCTFSQGINGRQAGPTSFYISTITGGGPSNSSLAGSEIQFTATYFTTT